jgi:hypothetical protein
MHDPGPVRPFYLDPQPGQKLVADGWRRELLERTAVYPFHHEQRRSASGLDHPLDTWDMDACPLGDYPDESLVLDRLDERCCRPGVTDISQAS